MSFNNSENWVILNPIELSIKEKIEQYGTKLQDWDLSINRGILTGYNDAFIIDEATKNSLIAADPKSAELIRPILRGKDIKRYTYSFANLYLICTFPSKHYDIDKYPAIRDYLLSFDKRRLAQTGEKDIDGIKGFNARKKTGNKWFETQDQINYSDDFFEQNIAWQRITHENTFCLTKENTVILDSMAFINGAKEKTYYLLAILNSSLVKFWMKKNVPEYGSSGYRFSNQFVTQIPVPLSVGEKDLAKINGYVKEYFEGKDTSNSINEFVFEIFKLTEEEIKYIASENYLYNQ